MDPHVVGPSGHISSRLLGKLCSRKSLQGFMRHDFPKIFLVWIWNQMSLAQVLWFELWKDNQKGPSVNSNVIGPSLWGLRLERAKKKGSDIMKKHRLLEMAEVLLVKVWSKCEFKRPLVGPNVNSSIIDPKSKAWDNVKGPMTCVKYFGWITEL